MASLKSFILEAMNLIGIEYREGPVSGLYTCTIPQPYVSRFNNRRTISITFNKDVTDDYPESEYVTEGSFFVNIISKLVLESSLATREFVRVAEVACEMLYPARGLQLRLISERQHYHPVFDFRMRLECVADEKYSEYFSIPLYASGKQLSEKTMTKLRNLPKGTDPERNIGYNLKTNEADFISQVYMKASDAVLNQTHSQILRFEQESNSRLVNDLKKLREHHETPAQHRAIQEQGIKEKYTVKVTVEPTGLNIIFLPLLIREYEVTKNDSPILKFNKTDRLYGQTPPHNCVSCDQQTSVINVCDEGKHVTCDFCTQLCHSCGRTGCINHKLGFCSECKQAICSACTTACITCKAEICQEHSHICDKCGNKSCSEHARTCKKTGQSLCANHAQKCSVCQDWYDHSLISKCHKCGAQVCSECQKICENGHTLCPDHASICTISGNTVCPQCSVICKSENHLVSKRLAHSCKICKSIICETHTNVCSICGETVCTDHVLSCSQCSELICLKDSVKCTCCEQPFGKDCVNNEGLCTACQQVLDENQPSEELDPAIISMIPFFERFLGYGWKLITNNSLYLISFRRKSRRLYVFRKDGELLIKKLI